MGKAVLEQTLIERINRRLDLDDEKLKKADSFRLEISAGRYFVVDAKHRITQRHVDLEQLARELGVLADGEEVSLGQI